MAKVDDILFDGYFFPIWCQNFEGQLKNLHQNLTITEGITTSMALKDLNEKNFKEMDFIDFCLLVYQERSDLIDYSQN